ncbi:transposase [Aquibacillus sediminis]|uniref:transposase n=1 Tax=Aquibacillus sediminis TaxID=2574734 RepID=UPI001FE2F928
MLRGINKQTIFEDDVDRLRLLDTIKNCKERGQIRVYGYCLMDNHIHLLLREHEEEPVSKFIQRLSASYVSWYNSKYERCGHLFQERFKSENVENLPKFLKVLRYIHQNPIKAGLAKDVFSCKWTSLHEYYVKNPSIVDTDLTLQLFSLKRTEAIQYFSDYMNKRNDDEYLDDYNQTRISDYEVINYVKGLGLDCSTLQHLEREKRNNILLTLKQLNGVTIRQLSRVTGISKSVIDRIK